MSVWTAATKNGAVQTPVRAARVAGKEAAHLPGFRPTFVLVDRDLHGGIAGVVVEHFEDGVGIAIEEIHVDRCLRDCCAVVGIGGKPQPLAVLGSVSVEDLDLPVGLGGADHVLRQQEPLAEKVQAEVAGHKAVLADGDVSEVVDFGHKFLRGAATFVGLALGSVFATNSSFVGDGRPQAEGDDEPADERADEGGGPPPMRAMP